MEAAKAAVIGLLQKLPDRLQVAFLVYGHNDAMKCQAVEVVHALGQLDADSKAKLIKFIGTLQLSDTHPSPCLFNWQICS